MLARKKGLSALVFVFRSSVYHHGKEAISTDRWAGRSFFAFSKEKSRGCGAVRRLIRTTHWSRDRQTAVICQASSLKTMYTVNFIVLSFRLTARRPSRCMYVYGGRHLNVFSFGPFCTCARNTFLLSKLWRYKFWIILIKEKFPIPIARACYVILHNTNKYLICIFE